MAHIARSDQATGVWPAHRQRRPLWAATASAWPAPDFAGHRIAAAVVRARHYCRRAQIHRRLVGHRRALTHRRLGGRPGRRLPPPTRRHRRAKFSTRGDAPPNHRSPSRPGPRRQKSVPRPTRRRRRPGLPPRSGSFDSTFATPIAVAWQSVQRRPSRRLMACPGWRLGLGFLSWPQGAIRFLNGR
jgi:hypothetical protein